MSLRAAERSLVYPSHVKERLDASGPITFSDRVVSTDEIWDFMTVEAPARFPYAFDQNGNNIARISADVQLVSGIKASYLTLTLYDRIEAARAAGVPVVFIQGGQNYEPYYAAGAVPLRPAFIMQWGRNKTNGLGMRSSDIVSNDHIEAGRRRISVDACQQIGAHGILHEGIVRADFIAPNLALRCSDMAYLSESHRSADHGAKLLFVDYPMNDAAGKPWAAQYVADDIRKLVTAIDEFTGRTTTDADLRAEIVRENEMRRLAREFDAIWQDAPFPPTNSIDRQHIVGLGNEGYLDPTAAISVLTSAVEEVRERAEDGVVGYGVAPDAVRLFVCGSCVTADPNVVDGSGGVVVGRDDQWSQVVTHTADDGDPYLALAHQTLAWPYEQPSERRAEWTADEVGRTRSDGLLFVYQWGCNFQSAIARLVADEVKRLAKIPTAYLSSNELGKAESVEQARTRVEAFIEMLRARKGLF
jgi:benzoyl-CoA reductase/2-hydroxyglutaryl-CoA dehydratase subunit BcrC/BadD/HgdB